MANGDITIVQFKGDETPTASTQLASLSPVVTADKLITWQHNNEVFVCKYEVG